MQSAHQPTFPLHVLYLTSPRLPSANLPTDDWAFMMCTSPELCFLPSTILCIIRCTIPCHDMKNHEWNLRVSLPCSSLYTFVLLARALSTLECHCLDDLMRMRRVRQASPTRNFSLPADSADAAENYGPQIGNKLHFRLGQLLGSTD